MNLKLKFLKCYVLSTLLYGCESWTISETIKKRLEATEMWFLRRMMRIPWVKKVTNERVLELAGTGRSLLTTIRKRQLQFIGHTIRKNGIGKLAIEGKINGKRARGRQRLEYMKSLALATGTTVRNILRLSQDRVGFRRLVANVRI